MKSLRRKLGWCSRTGQLFYKEQYSIYPWALSNECGIPHKSPKSHWTDKLKSRYASTTPIVFSNTITTEYIPQAAIIDAMFLMNTRPLRSTKTVSNYTKLLFTRFIKEHFNCSVLEVHVIFDKPKRREFNPKLFEHARRDNNKSIVLHYIFTNHLNRERYALARTSRMQNL